MEKPSFVPAIIKANGSSTSRTDRDVLARVATALALDTSADAWRSTDIGEAGVTIQAPARAYRQDDYALYVEGEADEAPTAILIERDDDLPLPSGIAISMSEVEEIARTMYLQLHDVLRTGQNEPSAAAASVIPELRIQQVGEAYYSVAVEAYYGDVVVDSLASFGILGDGQILAAYLQAGEWSADAVDAARQSAMASDQAGAIAEAAVVQDLEEVEQRAWRDMQRETNAYLRWLDGKLVWHLDYEVQVDFDGEFMDHAYQVEVDANAGDVRLLASSMK